MAAESAEELLKPLDPAVEEALTENHRAFLRFLARRLGSQHEAEDVLQKFYLKALSKAHGISKNESVVAWLYRIVRTTLADHYRASERRTRHEAAYAREQAVQTESPDADLHALVCECLYRLLPTLRAEYAEVLWRTDPIGEPRRKVAHALGLTTNNLTVRLHRRDRRSNALCCFPARLAQSMASSTAPAIRRSASPQRQRRFDRSVLRAVTSRQGVRLYSRSLLNLRRTGKAQR